MPGRSFSIVALAAFFLVVAGDALRAEEAGSAPGVATVREFVAAFNARDLERMLALADERIVWSSVEGEKFTVETAGRDELRASMTSYFASCPSCRSTLEWVEAAGSRVAAFERASWTTKAGVAKSQASLSVYELDGGKIARVVYFPAEP